MESFERRYFGFRQGARGATVRVPSAPRDDVRGPKDQAETIAVCVFTQRFDHSGLARFSAPGFVKILARYSYRGCGFSSPARKIPAIKPFPFEQDVL
jgi:hypothetical protein